MRIRTLVAGIAVVALLVAARDTGLHAEDAAALAGTVRSQEEGAMEGVLVTARRDGANFTVSVMSDARGRYRFPRTHLDPGKYTVTMRAVGYDLADPGPVDVPAKKASALDLRLERTKDLASQLTSVEWVMSWPGTDAQKSMVTKQAESCIYCHSVERIVKSKHSAEEFVAVVRRMATYYPDGSVANREGRGRAVLWPKATREAFKNATGRSRVYHPASTEWGVWPNASIADIGAYLATVNLSGGRTTWPYELKTLPRPKGKSTRVVITQYDQPRKDTVSHDAEIDARGNYWYTDESAPYIGKLDAKTGTFTEYELPGVPENLAPGGAQDITFDDEGNPWFPMRTAQGTLLTKFDLKTQAFQTVPGATGQFVAAPCNGKIWQGGQNGKFVRTDTQTMTVDMTLDWDKTVPVHEHHGYQIVVDSKCNPWITDRAWSHIVKGDAVTKEIKYWPTPTPQSMPRRGRMDASDRYWFAEHTADQVASFDAKTEQFREFKLPYRHSVPYGVSAPDSAGWVWASSSTSDRVFRVNAKSGEVLEYLIPGLPGSFDSKKISLDPTTSRPVVWMENVRAARILKIEPLD